MCCVDASWETQHCDLGKEVDVEDIPSDILTKLDNANVDQEDIVDNTIIFDHQEEVDGKIYTICFAVPFLTWDEADGDGGMIDWDKPSYFLSEDAL
jgi:hypothetical protein